MRYLLVVLLLFPMSSSAVPTTAPKEELICKPIEEVRSILEANGATRQGYGLDYEDHLLELYRNAAGDKFIFLYTIPKGAEMKSCRMLVLDKINHSRRVVLRGVSPQGTLMKLELLTEGWKLIEFFPPINGKKREGIIRAGGVDWWQESPWNLLIPEAGESV